MHQQHLRRRRPVVATAAAALAAGTIGGVGPQPARATMTGGGVTDGHSITVVHNIDTVSARGWAPGERVTVRVMRNGVRIGSATGPATGPAVGSTAEGAGLEINHAPEGTSAPGDCWDDTTPDIQPGDVIRATNGTLTDEVTVDDIEFDGPPAEDRATGDVVVPVFAMRHGGTPFTAAELDAGGFRSPDFDLRASSAEDPAFVQVEEVDAAAGRFELRYVEPFGFGRNGDDLTAEQIRRELLGDGHMIGFGHSEPPPADAQIVEGHGENTAPAPGCEGSPMARYAVTEIVPTALNIANEGSGLTVSGLSQDASSVQVVLRSGSVEIVGGPVTPTPGTGAQTWTAELTPDQLAGLGDGVVTVAARYTHAASGATLTGRSRTVLKDRVAPVAPTASLPGGSYLGRQDVSIDAGPEALVRYTLGDGTQPAPTATSGTRYAGRRIALTSTQVLKMVGVDAAGNASDVVTERYAIRPRITPARPRIGEATAGPGRATVRWSRPAANGGPRVTGYRIRVYRRTEPVGSVDVGPRARQRTVRGLANGHWHRFTVAARNTVGLGVQSARSNVVTPRGAPARPRTRPAVSGAPGGAATARARWAVPRSDGGRRITGYRVTALRLRANGSVADRRTSRLLSPGARATTMRLPRGRYRFAVRAVNALGGSRWSARSNLVRSR